MVPNVCIVIPLEDGIRSSFVLIKSKHYTPLNESLKHILFLVLTMFCWILGCILFRALRVSNLQCCCNSGHVYRSRRLALCSVLVQKGMYHLQTSNLSASMTLWWRRSGYPISSGAYWCCLRTVFGSLYNSMWRHEKLNTDVTIFWNVTPCNMVKVCLCSMGTYDLYLQGWRMIDVFWRTKLFDPENTYSMFLRNDS
jgi:hypothetical protein